MFKNYFYILMAGCSFGLLSVIVKTQYGNGFTLSDVSGAQALFGAIILWLIFALNHKNARKIKNSNSVSHKYSIAKLLLTGVASGLISITYYKCVQLIPASIAIVLLMQYTWMSMLLEKIIFKIHISKKQLYCVALILLGTILAAGIFKETAINNHLSLQGIVYGLLGGFFYAVFLMANGRVGNHYTSLKKSAIISLGVCLVVFALLPPVFIWNGSLTKIVKWGIPLGLFGMVLPPILFAIAIPKIGISLSSILSSVELPTAVALSYFVLNESISWIQILGVIIILSSIIFINIKYPNSTITDPHQAK